MRYDIYNPTKATRILFDAEMRSIEIKPGNWHRGAQLMDIEVKRIMNSVNDLMLIDSQFVGPPQSTKHPLLVSTMWGIGDVIHSRAVVREMMKTNEVWLETSNPAIFHDLALRSIPRGQPPRIREADSKFHSNRSSALPENIMRRKISYDTKLVHATGSVLAAQFASSGVTMPAMPDFRMSIPPAWTERLWKTFNFPRGSKPLLVYRPIVLNRIWNCPLRSPLPEIYNTLFKSIKERFFTVSIADLSANEWIVGPEPEVDIKIHHGELDFQMMAALFAEASVTFTNPGFSPILSQAVGTPTIVVYGGYENFATTHSYGAKLTPTLPIQTDAPCDCFSHSCSRRCCKQIAIPSALDKIERFIHVN